MWKNNRFIKLCQVFCHSHVLYPSILARSHDVHCFQALTNQLTNPLQQHKLVESTNTHLYAQAASLPLSSSTGDRLPT